MCSKFTQNIDLFNTDILNRYEIITAQNENDMS